MWMFYVSLRSTPQPYVCYFGSASPHDYESWEGQVIQIKKSDYLNKAINLVNLYRSPKDIIEKYNELTREIYPLLRTLETSNNKAIITGDFNIDLLKINDKKTFSDYFDTLTSYSVYPKIILSMRLSNNHVTNFLGLTINEHLNWRDHINKISCKISKTMRVLNKLKLFLPKQAKLHIYDSLIVFLYSGIGLPV